MKPNNSQLQWVAFKVFEWEFKTITPDDGEDAKFSPNENLKNHPIDVDFNHFENEENKILVNLHIRVNSKNNPEPGYLINFFCVAQFDLSEIKSLDDKQQQNLKYFATTNFTIGRARNLISVFTSQGLFGSYELPSLDITDFFRQKSKLSKSEKPKKIK